MVPPFRKFNSFQNFWKLLRETSVPFDAVSKFSKVLVEWKAPSKALCFISAARYCFRNIDLARQVPHQFDLQPRMMSSVPACLLICHENKARLFTRKLELQFVLTSEMKDFIAPLQIACEREEKEGEKRERSDDRKCVCCSQATL